MIAEGNSKLNPCVEMRAREENQRALEICTNTKGSFYWIPTMAVLNVSLSQSMNTYGRNTEKVTYQYEGRIIAVQTTSKDPGDRECPGIEQAVFYRLSARLPSTLASLSQSKEAGWEN